MMIFIRCLVLETDRVGTSLGAGPRFSRIAVVLFGLPRSAGSWYIGPRGAPLYHTSVVPSPLPGVSLCWTGVTIPCLGRPLCSPFSLSLSPSSLYNQIMCPVSLQRKHPHTTAHRSDQS